MIERVPVTGNGGTSKIRLVACPCGREFQHGEIRWRHFYESHGPSDFGLTPIGKRRGQPRGGSA